MRQYLIPQAGWTPLSRSSWMEPSPMNRRSREGMKEISHIFVIREEEVVPKIIRWALFIMHAPESHGWASCRVARGNMWELNGW